MHTHTIMKLLNLGRRKQYVRYVAKGIWLSLPTPLSYRDYKKVQPDSANYMETYPFNTQLKYETNLEDIKAQLPPFSLVFSLPPSVIPTCPSNCVTLGSFSVSTAWASTITTSEFLASWWGMPCVRVAWPYHAPVEDNMATHHLHDSLECWEIIVTLRWCLWSRWLGRYVIRKLWLLTAD